MIIRTALPGDLEAFRDLRLTSLRDAPTAFGSDYEQTLAMPLSHFQDRMTIDDYHYLYFAEEDSRLVGMTGVLRDASPKRAHYVTIWGVFVRAEVRGQRIADQLVNACLTWARAHGALYARLAVNATNTRAINCYVRCGFRVYGVEHAGIHWESTFYDDLLMVCDL
ncbi:MAG: GNAT family N-acetyltransferase [Anaerolineae bacterium]|nr:GNAT family N-acetyltransferase [Anaerolineae bacterium]